MTIKTPIRTQQKSHQNETVDRPSSQKRSNMDKKSKAFISDQSTWEIIMEDMYDDVDENSSQVQHHSKQTGAKTVSIESQKTSINRRLEARQNPRVAQPDSNTLNTDSTHNRKKTIAPKRSVNSQQRQNALNARSISVVSQGSGNEDNNRPAFVPRDINNDIHPQNLEEVQVKLKRKRFSRYAGIFLQFFVKYVGIAVVFSGLGYYYGINVNRISSSDTVHKPVVHLEPMDISNNTVPKQRVGTDKSRFEARQKQNLKSKPKHELVIKPKVEKIVQQPFENYNVGISEQTSESLEQIEKPIVVPVENVSVQELEQSTDIDAETRNGTISEQTVEINSVETPPATPTINEYSDLSLQELLERNVQAYKTKQWTAVLDTSTEILKLQPNTINALINRSVAHTELGLYDLAVKDCNLAIEIDTLNPLAYNNRGYAYEMMGNKFPAITDYSKACELGIELACKEVVRLKK